MSFDQLKAHELREGDVMVDEGTVLATVSDVRQTTDDDGAPEVTVTLTLTEGEVRDATWAADADLGPTFVRAAQWEGALEDAALAVRREQALAEELAAQAERDAAAEADTAGEDE